MIAVRSSISFTLTHLQQNPSGKYLIISASFNNQPHIIVNIYAPMSTINRSISLYYKKIHHCPRDQIIICGDFNKVIDPQMYSSNTKRRKSTTLSSPISLKDLYDPWRCHYSTERDYSLLEYPKIILQDRLDSQGTITKYLSNHDRNYHVVKPRPCNHYHSYLPYLS